MTLLDRAIESAQARLDMHRANLERSEGNEQTIAKLKKRYPDGFSAERSVNRE